MDFSADIIIIICYLFSQVYHFTKCISFIIVKEKNEMCHTLHPKSVIRKLFLTQIGCFADTITLFCLYCLQFQWLYHRFMTGAFCSQAGNSQ